MATLGQCQLFVFALGENYGILVSLKAMNKAVNTLFKTRV